METTGGVGQAQVQHVTEQKTINQLVAHNAKRLREARRWTLEETAEKLTAASGQQWTATSLGAAERSWSSGRSRRFDANEIFTFGQVFNVDLAELFKINHSYVYRLVDNADSDFQLLDADQLRGIIRKTPTPTGQRSLLDRIGEAVEEKMASASLKELLEIQYELQHPSPLSRVVGKLF